MKKILAILICTLTLNAHATEMCARDDTVVVPLDATIEFVPNSMKWNLVESMWWIDFEYGRLYGASGCFSLNEIRIIQNDPNMSSSNIPYELSTNNEKYIANSGWYNGDESDPDNARIFCYHQLTHPMLSRWYALYNERGFGTPKNCMDNCMTRAAGGMLGTLARRRDLFDTIGK